MKSVDQKKIHKFRKRHNHDLIKRMRDGDPLKGFDSQSSWFPPRPIIKKDAKAIKKLYGKEDFLAGKSKLEKPAEEENQMVCLSLVEHDNIA